MNPAYLVVGKKYKSGLQRQQEEEFSEKSSRNQYRCYQDWL